MFTKLPSRVMAAVVVLLAASIGARLAYALLTPLVPAVVGVMSVLVVYAVLFNRRR